MHLSTQQFADTIVVAPRAASTTAAPPSWKRP